MGFKNLFLSIFISSALIILTGCGGGGGGGSASGGGGFGFMPTNSSNTNVTPDLSSSTPSQTDNNNTNDSTNNPASTIRKNYNYSTSGKGETITIVIDCYKDWKIGTLKSLSDINVSPTSGTGTGEILTITVPINKTDKEQKITIPIIAKDGTTISTISITQQINKTKDWLFINYFACDNSLENFQLDSLNAMEKVGSDENTHLIAYYDIGDRWYLQGRKYDNIISKEEWSGGAREFYLTKDDTNKITSPVIKYYDDIYTNSANPEILADFLLRAIENYPAEKICISITNHGGAYLGAISDETIDEYYNTCSTSLSGIYWAINEVYQKIGKKIDLLLFDDCLMSNFEVAYEFKDIVSYIVGSEEISLVSVVDGMNGSVDYHGFLTETATRASRNNAFLSSDTKSSIDLTNLNSININLSDQIKKIQKGLKSKITADYDGQKLAEAILKANKDRRDKFLAGDYSFTNYNTCSIMDCSKCDSLKDAISDFSNYVINANETDKTAVKAATGDLIATYAKVSDIEGTYENISDYYGLVQVSDQRYIKYKPLGEIYGPFFDYCKIEEVPYLFSVSEYEVADIGYIMQRIFSPTDVYGENIPEKISSASQDLKDKAETVYNALKQVVPDNYYYDTDKISLVMNDNHIYYDYDSNGEIIRKYSYYAPFGYHKYSNGLSIGWFVYNKDDIFQKWIKYDEDGNPTTNIYNRFNKLIEDNKKEYTMNGGPTFYKDCPKWIQMQESLMQESL